MKKVKSSTFFIGVNVTDRTINNPVEGSDTKAVENPAPPGQPAFPSPNETLPSLMHALNNTTQGARQLSLTSQIFMLV